MNQYNIAVLGATGAVGQQMIRCLEEQHLPVRRLLPLASKNSAGKSIRFRETELTVEEANFDSFQGMDIVLGAVGNDLAKQLLPHAVKAGALVIDNSSAYRMDENVPLIIPEINAEEIKHHHGIIANPNCATIIGLLAAYPLHQKAHLVHMIASTYQAVSGAGNPGLIELQHQIEQIANGDPVAAHVFPYPIAYNVIPQIGDFKENGYTAEEMKMQNEGRKIMRLPHFTASCTCVRIPVYRCHSEALTLRFANPITPKQARALLQKAPGVRLIDDLPEQQYPMPFNTGDQDLVSVGRIRQDITDPSGCSLTLWCCGDQLRKGAATNAIQIAAHYIHFIEHQHCK